MLRSRTPFSPQMVVRRGDTVLRDTTPWTPAVHALLRHLEGQGVEAPVVLGSGVNDEGMETLTYVPGGVDPVSMLSIEGSAALGVLLREHHAAASSFPNADSYDWFPWRARRLGTPTVVGHSDLGPWNIVRREGLPVAFIDWTRAGPIDPVVELAQVCWLNAHLHDDVVAEAEGLPGIDERVKHLRAIIDGYGLPASQRPALIDLIRDVAVMSAAADADDARVGRHIKSPETPEELVWCLTWQVRGAAWQIENREVLLDALL